MTTSTAMRTTLDCCELFQHYQCRGSLDPGRWSHLPFCTFTNVVLCPQAPCHNGAAGVPAGAAEHRSGICNWFSARSARCAVLPHPFVSTLLDAQVALSWCMNSLRVS